MRITFFRSIGDRDALASERSWDEIVARAREPRAYPSKQVMPLIKLAAFGSARSLRGFLRNEDNMIALSGVEGDYDAGRVHPEDAIALLAMAGLAALVYTTPSHSAVAPRWRVLAPLAAEAPPAARLALLGRINGALGGVLAAESFVPAQTYFWGRVASAPYAAYEARGACVDELPGLDASAVVPSVRPPPAAADAAPVAGALAEGGRNRGLFSLGSALRRRSVSPEGILAALLAENAARCVPPLPEDEVRTIARSAGQYTPSVDYGAAPVVPVLPADPPPEVVAELQRIAEVVDRGERFMTGVLVPQAVLDSPEMRLTSFDGVLEHRNGAYPNSLYNCTQIARATLNGRLWLDLSTKLPMNHRHPLSEVDSIRLTRMVGGISGGQNFRDATMFKAMVGLAHDNPYDPWTEWLARLRWDGVERLNSMAEDFFGVRVGEDQLERLIFRKLMVAAVARQFNPGAKFDAMVVLEGAQGTRKSTALRTLFGDPYVASWEHDFNTKDFRQQLQGNMCIEVAELASFARSDLNAIKSILSETVDVFRPSYGRTVERRPRRCVLVGTSNDDSYLTDATGNRRFWPVRCGMIDTDGLAEVRDQLFAEAVVAFRAGGDDARWWELPARMAEEQAGRMVEDPWADALHDHLMGEAVAHVHKLMDRPLNIPVERQSSGVARRIAGLLRQLGWVRRHGRDGNYWERE
jgi:hypothetical protein